jgi:hypothetical protein
VVDCPGIALCKTARSTCLTPGGGVMLGNEGSRVAARRYRHPPRKRGSRGWLKPLRPRIPAFHGNDGRADHRGVDALASAEQVDRPLFRPGASFCGKSRARSAAARITAPPPSVTRQHCNKRNGLAIISELSTSPTVIGVLKVAQVLRRPFALHDRDHCQLLMRLFCRSRASGNPGLQGPATRPWTPLSRGRRRKSCRAAPGS